MNTGGNILEVKEIGKSYATNLRSTIHALCDVSFSAVKGDFITVIGNNGSGKSTLLKIIGGILKPSSGFVKIKGNVLAVTEMGAGMEPELNGYENAKLLIKLYGINTVNFNDAISFITDFSELGDKLNMPVKNYSQGMYLRLAFAILLCLKVDIILMDEVLAVGDVAFKKKCLEQIQKLVEKGVVFIYVTHNFSEVSELTNKCIWLDNGKVVSIGNPAETYSRYLARNSSSVQLLPNISLENFKVNELIEGCAKVIGISANCVDASGNKISEIKFDRPFQIEIKYKKLLNPSGITIILHVHDNLERPLISISNLYGMTAEEKTNLINQKPGEYSEVFQFPAFFLNAGLYKIGFVVNVFDDIHHFKPAVEPISLYTIKINDNAELAKTETWVFTHFPIRIKSGAL